MKNSILLNEIASFKVVKLFVIMFLSTVVLSGCNNDDDGGDPVIEEDNIVEIAIANGYNTLAAALVEAGLDDDLQTEGPFTVFAPTDAAFAAIGITPDNVAEVDGLENILLYHVVSGRLMSGDLSSGPQEALNGEELIFDVSNGVMINGSVSVVEPFDIEGSNGIIHTVNEVILLPTEEPQSIVDVVVNDENFSILEAALIKAGLVDALSADGPFTVFAPTNAAFEAAGITSLDDYTAEELAPILLYHVVNGGVMSTDLSNGQVVSTLNESADLYLSVNDNGVFINGKTMVSATDMEVSNGIIHVIDQTLIPPTQDIVSIAIDAGFAKLAEALTEAGLVETLQGEGPFTVFAPTDAAFDALYQRLGVQGPAEIDDATLEAVLTYHVLGARVFSSDLTDGAMPETLQGGTVTVNIGDNVTVTDVDSESADATVSSTDILGTNGVIHVIDQILLPVEL